MIRLRQTSSNGKQTCYDVFDNGYSTHFKVELRKRKRSSTARIFLDNVLVDRMQIHQGCAFAKLRRHIADLIRG